MVISFVPLKSSASRNLHNFLIGTLYQREHALVPLPFQKRSIQACLYQAENKDFLLSQMRWVDNI